MIAGGGLALAQQMGYLDQLPDSIWMWIFGLVSLVSFISYALRGWRDWGWLFPAGVFGGLAVIVGLAVSGYDNAAIGSPLFFGLLIPFIAAYLTNRANNWWALIPMSREQLRQGYWDLVRRLYAPGAFWTAISESSASLSTSDAERKSVAALGKVSGCRRWAMDSSWSGPSSGRSAGMGH